MALPSGLAGQVRQGLKGLEIIRPAVGVAGVINGVDTEDQPGSAAGFRQAEADGDEHGVTTWHVGGRDHAVLHTACGDPDRCIGESGAAPGGQVDVDAVVFGQAEVFGDRCGCFQFTPVPLAVVEGEGDHPITGLQGQSRCRGRIQAAGQQRDGGALSHVVI